MHSCFIVTTQHAHNKVTEHLHPYTVAIAERLMKPIEYDGYRFLIGGFIMSGWTYPITDLKPEDFPKEWNGLIRSEYQTDAFVDYYKALGIQCQGEVSPIFLATWGYEQAYLDWYDHRRSDAITS